MDDDNSERVGSESKNEEGEQYRSILVVGLTKEMAYQFVRIDQGKDQSIYVAFAYRGNKPRPHFSYHASGEVHRVYVDQNGDVVKADKKFATPLAKFQETYNLGIWVVVSPDFPLWKELTVTKDRKAQAMMCFDMSNWVLGQQLSINCTLVESGRVDLLCKMMGEIPQNLKPQTLIITTTNPWIVIRAAQV